MRRVLRLVIGLIWLVNGLFCKVIGGVPRHQEIVAKILGDEFSGPLTVLIGFGEIVIALWIWSGRFRVACGWIQITLVLTMNMIEQVLASGFLLWGPWNLLWAFGFSIGVWWAFLREEALPC